MKRTLVFAVFAIALSLAPGHLVLVQTAQDPQSKPLVFTHGCPLMNRERILHAARLRGNK